MKWVCPECVVYFFYFFCKSLVSYNTTIAERRARNSAGAEALAVARRPDIFCFVLGLRTRTKRPLSESSASTPG